MSWSDKENNVVVCFKGRETYEYLSERKAVLRKEGMNLKRALKINGVWSRDCKIRIRLKRYPIKKILKMSDCVHNVFNDKLYTVLVKIVLHCVTRIISN